MSLAVFPTGLRGLTYPVMKSSGFNTLKQEAPNKLSARVAQTYNPVWEWSLIYDFLADDPDHLPMGVAYSEYRILQGFILSQGGEFGEFLYSDPSDRSIGPALIAGAPNPLAELQLVNDGAGSYYSPIQRNFGGQFYEDITDLDGALAVYANGVLKTAGTDYYIVGPGLAIPGASYMGLAIAWATPPAWAAGAVYATNDEIMDPAGHVQKATTGGTSGSSIPTFNDTGGTTSEGPDTLQWTDQGMHAGPTGPISITCNFYFRVCFGEDTQDFEQFLNQMWTIGGSEARGGSGYLKLASSRPAQV